MSEWVKYALEFYRHPFRLKFRNSDYHAGLSKASQLTLIAQGGPMDAEEAASFEARSDFKALIR